MFWFINGGSKHRFWVKNVLDLARLVTSKCIVSNTSDQHQQNGVDVIRLKRGNA